MMNKDSLAAFSEELSRILPHIVRGMFKRQTDALGRGKITIPQYLSLDLLNTHGVLKMKDIAKELNISLPAATGLISRLHRLGMVKRIFDEKDRRVIYITPTPKGKATTEHIRRQRQRAVQEVFSKLTEKERDSYLRILRKLKKILYPEQQ
jgi:DNA-binding MarR family transcriptional regulator